jgi:hypothetical protein
MRARWLFAVTFCVLALAGCSSGSDVEVLSSEPAGGGAVEGSTSDNGSAAGVGAPLTLADITCSATPVGGPATADPVTVSCSELHDYEAFEIPGDRLNDCVTTIAASSDIVIVPDTDPGDEGEFEIDDPRVSGHSYSTGGDGVSCQITLAEPRRGALLG